MTIIQYGLYNVKDNYFIDFKSAYLPDNKQENRPYYCAIVDKDGIIWLIPLSTKVTEYKQKIEVETAKRGSCLFYYIGKIKGEDSVFQIGNAFPISEKYIKKPYTIAGVQYIVANEQLKKELHKRFSKFIALVKQGKLTPNVDIMAIKRHLLEDPQD